MAEDILNQNIIKELGLESLPDERKVVLLEKMADLIQKRIAFRVLEVVSGKDKKEFEKLIRQDNKQAINQFLSLKVPNMREIIEQEIVKFKKEAKDSSSLNTAA